MKTINDVKPPPLVAVEYAGEVRKRLGSHARRIILFGSRARGESSEGSDHDFIVIVDRWSRKACEQVSDAGCAMLERHDALCAALVYDGEEWSDVLQSPLGWNVERDGIAL